LASTAVFGATPAHSGSTRHCGNITDNELHLTSDRRHNPRYVEQLVSFVRGADVLITDTTYRDAEYLAKVDWGHSCVSQVAKLAARAQVKRLHLFHHDIDQTDEAIDLKLAEAREGLARLGAKVECEAPVESSTLVLEQPRQAV